MRRPAEPWSTLTALMYPLMGYLGYEVTRSPEGAVFGLFMLTLGAGTAWRHWSPSKASSTADQMAMHFVFAGLVVYALGGGWLLMTIGGIAAGVFLEERYDLQLRPTFGLYVALIVVGMLSGGAWEATGSFLAIMGIAFLVREGGGDRRHAFWHSATGVGILVAFLAL